MRYFTDSPFERLMMEKPCGHSRAAEVAWERERRRSRDIPAASDDALQDDFNIKNKPADWGADEQKAAPHLSALRRQKNP